MTTVRIDQLHVRPDGIRTAVVTADGADPVLVDDSIGAWTFPNDPTKPPDAVCSRRVVRGWCVELLNLAVKTGQPQETHRARETPVRRPTLLPKADVPKPEQSTVPSIPDAMARYMAEAGAAAVKEAA